MIPKSENIPELIREKWAVVTFPRWPKLAVLIHNPTQLKDFQLSYLASYGPSSKMASWSHI
jgi:hypothetical protein